MTELKYGDKVLILPERSYSWTGETYVIRSLNNGALIEVKNLVNEIAASDPGATIRVPAEFVKPTNA